MSPRRRPEDVIQRSVFAHIRARGVKGLVAVHYPAGGFRKPVEAKILSGLGVAKGVPDILAWHAGKAFALELKADRGKLSAAQAEMLERLAAAGAYVAVEHGVDAAVRRLEDWGLLRGHVT